MDTRARERWRKALESWALPPALLEAVDESPYPSSGSSPRWTGPSLAADPTPTDEAIADVVGSGGSILDVGAGRGRLAVPLAADGHRVTAVEPDDEAAALLAEAIAEAGVSVARVLGRWPDVAGNAGRHDVVLSAHVVYDVPVIGPFLDAMHRGARRGVVLEVTPRHPWNGLSRYFRLLHGHQLPRRPTVDDLEAVVREVTGAEPRVRWWEAPATPRFASLPELLAFYRRRLLVPPERSLEAAGLLEPDVEQADDGSLVLGPPERDLVTMWWRV